MPFNRYTNSSGLSGVKATKSERGKLTVKFKDGSRYVYTNGSAGRYPMRRMKQLASKGQGLNGYINTSVKKNYESKKRWYMAKKTPSYDRVFGDNPRNPNKQDIQKNAPRVNRTKKKKKK